MTTPTTPPIPPSPRPDRQYQPGTFRVPLLEWKEKWVAPETVEVDVPAEVYGPFAVFWWPKSERPLLTIGHLPTGAWITHPQGKRVDDKRANAELVIDSLEAMGLERWQCTDPQASAFRALIAEWYPHLCALRERKVCS